VLHLGLLMIHPDFRRRGLQGLRYVLGAFYAYRRISERPAWIRAPPPKGYRSRSPETGQRRRSQRARPQRRASSRRRASIKGASPGS
jgi:hypothetical protein